MSNVKIIDRQQSGLTTKQAVDVLVYFQTDYPTHQVRYKVFIHLDKSYPWQSKIYTSMWTGSEWSEVYLMFGETARGTFDWDLEKIEKHLIQKALEITGVI